MLWGFDLLLLSLKQIIATAVKKYFYRGSNFFYRGSNFLIFSFCFLPKNHFLYVNQKCKET